MYTLQTTLSGARWLLTAPNGLHCVSLLPNHYPQPTPFPTPGPSFEPTVMPTEFSNTTLADLVPTFEQVVWSNYKIMLQVGICFWGFQLGFMLA